MKNKIPVALLGATGTVGQKLITLLADHPWFEITELAASSRSAGQEYASVCLWKQNTPIPNKVAGMKVLQAGHPLKSRILFSGMDASAAGPIEADYAKAGHAVISNAKNHRMDTDVPIIIPEINPSHFEISRLQKNSGVIITNSNCVAMPAAMVLGPLHEALGIKWVQLTSMQAVSGAGYPGVPSYDIMGNVIPFISGEEPKVECEIQKILGSIQGDSIVPADFIISAQCNRVPVIDGHTLNLSIQFKTKLSPEEAPGTVKHILEQWSRTPQKHNLPSAPAAPLVIFEQDDRPQPARDAMMEGGMAACVGRIRVCPIGDVKMVVMGHNTLRGAAGAAVLNAEAFTALGYLDKISQS